MTDPAAPSLCEGWTRGHVLSHVARNADGLVRLARSVVDGTGETMYDSRPKRTPTSRRGRAGPVDELVADVETSAVPLADELPRLGPEHADAPRSSAPRARSAAAGPTSSSCGCVS